MSTPVVYLDDEPLLCRAFEAVLKRSGYAVVTFTDPFDAIAFVNANIVALVFCDYRMPKLNGLEVVGRITTEAPIYMVSGDFEVERRLRDDGRIAGMLPKPFRAEEVLAIVRVHVAKT
jgi:DNA-binding response OmpR family regulator